MAEIVNTLKTQKVLTPRAFLYQKTGLSYYKNSMDKPYDWSHKTLYDMLFRQEYIGNTVNFRFTKPSFKIKQIKRNPPEKYQIIENTHEPIISREVWDIVQKDHLGTL